MNRISKQDLHPETMDQIQSLRDIRLALARKQLASIDQTMDQLLSRGLIPAGTSRVMLRKELELELLGRIAEFEGHSQSASPEEVNVDELTFYVEVLPEAK